MLKYQISLCNVWWNKNDINTRYFDTTNDQITYFETLTGGEYSPLVNFNMGDFIETTVIYKDNSSKTPEQLVRSNYAVVKRTETTIENDVEVTHVDYRLFFAKCYQDSGRQMRVDLSLDDIQTNYFKYKANIAPCLINRAHLNRWINVVGDNTKVKFNTNSDSLLFKNEDIEISKIAKDKRKPTLETEISSTYQSWLNDNVLCWLYVFLDNHIANGRRVFNAYRCDDHNDTSLNLLINSLKHSVPKNEDIDFSNLTNLNDDNYAILIYPIYKTSKKIIFKNRVNDTWNDYTWDVLDFNNDLGIECFKSLNNNTSYVLSTKLSIIQPKFATTDIMTIDENTGNLFINTVGNNGILNTVYNSITRFSKRYDSSIEYCTLTTKELNPKQKYHYYGNSTYTNFNFEYLKTSIVGVNHNVKLNPKYYSSQITELTLHTNSSEGYNYDIFKLGKPKDLEITYVEQMQPEVNRTFAYIKPESAGIMNSAQVQSYIGDSNTQDTSMPVVNDKYAEFIANNKNYWLQQNANMVTSIFGGISNVLTGNINGAISDVVNIANKGVQTWANADNLKNAPGSLKNANVNVITALSIDTLQPVVTLKQALDCDIKTFDDYINKYGFAVGIVDNISNYDNIRKYFNYIECQVEVISAPISDEEKDRLKQKLSAIRFWNSDTINYVKENYERSLENNG